MNDFLPDEILIHIFCYISEVHLCDCKLVCRKWNTVANDHRLIYYFREKHAPLPKKLIKSCEYGDIISFNIGVSVYCTFNLPTIYGLGAGTHDLWVRCMIAAAKGGHLPILKKILRYGPTYGFREAKEIARSNGHIHCVEILEMEGIKI